MSDQLRRLQAASVDGRAQNARFAQNQLKRLFEVLIKNKTSVKIALRNDTSYLPAEIEAEYYLTLETIRESYKSISNAKALENEYSIANNKDNSLRRVPVGCVYIVPARHTPLYATIAPLCAAIAAGNCVAIELKQTLSELNALLRRSLTAALDTGTFLALDQKPDNEEFFSSCILVQETEISSDSHPSQRQLSSPSLSRVLAIIDRTANIQTAAHNIVHSRFGFKGRSPYAPDVVLVNEFALKDFCTAAAQQAITYFAKQVDETTNGFAHKTARKDDDNGDMTKALAEDGSETLVSASQGSIVLVKNRTSPFLHRKLPHPILVIHPISSLDDAIDTSISCASGSSTSPLLASYLFANSASAKYLSQFIPATISMANSIPSTLLLGPAYPSGFTPSLSSSRRFTEEMFTVPAAEFVVPDRGSMRLAQVLYSEEKGEKTLREETLPPTDQPKGGAVGFFEQGLLTGGVILLTGVIGTATLLGIYAVPAVLKRLR